MSGSKNYSTKPFYHEKESPLNARVSKPEVRFARRLLEQFGGPFVESKYAAEESDLPNE